MQCKVEKEMNQEIDWSASFVKIPTLVRELGEALHDKNYALASAINGEIEIRRNEIQNFIEKKLNINRNIQHLHRHQNEQ